LIGETPAQYVYAMIDLIKEADSSMTEARQVRCILKGLRPSYLEKVHDKNPQTVMDVLKAIRQVSATQFLLERRLESNAATFSAETAMEELTSHITDPNSPFISNITKSLAALVVAPPPAPPPAQPEVRCTYCGRLNHLVSVCRARQAHYNTRGGYKSSPTPSHQPAARSCYLCGSFSHLANRCPQSYRYQQQMSGNHYGRSRGGNRQPQTQNPPHQGPAPSPQPLMEIPLTAPANYPQFTQQPPPPLNG